MAWPLSDCQSHPCDTLDGDLILWSTDFALIAKLKSPSYMFNSCKHIPAQNAVHVTCMLHATSMHV